MKKIIISTGGTGGHVIPARILYDYLLNENQIIITSDKCYDNVEWVWGYKESDSINTSETRAYRME